MKRIFLSYPSERILDATTVSTALKEAGLKTTLAPDDIPHGTEWASWIVETIVNCQALICLFYQESLNKPYCLEEVRIAFEHDLPRLTIIKSSLPDGKFALYLNSGQYFFRTADTLAEHLPTIVDAAKEMLERGSNPDSLLSRIGPADISTIDDLFSRLGIVPPHTLRNSAKPVRCIELAEYLEDRAEGDRESIIGMFPDIELSVDHLDGLKQLRRLRKNDRSDHLSTYLTSFWRPHPVFNRRNRKQITVIVGGEGQGRTRALYEIAGSAVEFGIRIVCGNGPSVPLHYYAAGAVELVKRLRGPSSINAKHLPKTGIVIDDFDTWFRPSQARGHAEALRSLESSLAREAFIVISCRSRKWQEMCPYLEPLLSNIEVIRLREFTTKEKIEFLRQIVPVGTDIGPTIRSGFLMAFGSCRNLLELGKAIRATGSEAPVKAFPEILDRRIARLASDLNLDPSDRAELLTFLIATAENFLLRGADGITASDLIRRLGRTTMFRNTPDRAPGACRAVIEEFFRVTPLSDSRYGFKESWVPVCLLAAAAAKQRRPWLKDLRLATRVAPGSMRQFGVVYWYVLLRSALNLDSSLESQHMELAGHLGDLVDAAELAGARAKALAGQVVLNRIRSRKPAFGFSSFFPKLDLLHHLASTSPELMFQTLERFIQHEGLSSSLVAVIARFLVYEQTKDDVARLIREHVLLSSLRDRRHWNVVALQAALFAPDHVALESTFAAPTPFLRWSAILVEVIRPSLRSESFRRAIIAIFDRSYFDEHMALEKGGDITRSVEAILAKFNRKIIRELDSNEVTSRRGVSATVLNYLLSSLKRAALGLCGILIVLARPVLHRIFGFRAEVVRDLSAALERASRMEGGDMRISKALDGIPRTAGLADLILFGAALTWVRLAQGDPADLGYQEYKPLMRARAVVASLIDKLAESLGQTDIGPNECVLAEMSALVLGWSLIEGAEEPCQHLQLAIANTSSPTIKRTFDESMSEIRMLSGWGTAKNGSSIFDIYRVLQTVPTIVSFTLALSMLPISNIAAFRSNTYAFSNRLVLAAAVLLPVGMSFETSGAVNTPRLTIVLHRVGLVSPVAAAILIQFGTPFTLSLFVSLIVSTFCVFVQWLKCRQIKQVDHLELMSRRGEAASLQLTALACLAMSLVSSVLPGTWPYLISLFASAGLLWYLFSLRARLPGRLPRWVISAVLFGAFTATLKLTFRSISILLRPTCLFLLPLRMIGCLVWFRFAALRAFCRLAFLMRRGYLAGNAYADQLFDEMK